MTKAHTKNDGDSRQWFLRTGGEAVFGPVSTEGLIVWAEQGRVLPGHEVSIDRKTWQSAVTLDVLDMRWFIDEGDGELRGPLNRIAAEALLESGKVDPESQIVCDDEVEVPESGEGEGVSEVEGAGDSVAGEPEGGESEIEAVSEAEPEGEKRVGVGVASRASQSLPDEVLHARIRELELLVSEQRERLQRVAEAGSLETVQHERDLLKALLEEKEQEYKEACSVAGREVAESGRQLEAVSAELEEANKEREKLQGRLVALEGEVAEQIRVVDEQRSLQVAAKLSFERAKDLASELSGRLAKAEARIEELDGELATLLQESNSRDSESQERIAELEKLCAITPQQVDKMYSEQSAAYELLKSESDALGSALDHERAHFESLKSLMGQRIDSLIERRNALMRQLGSGPADMVRHLTRGQAIDANFARLRDELTELRRAHQQKLEQFEESEREHDLKRRVLESEIAKLRPLAAVGEESEQRLTAMNERLKIREHELAEERKMREAEREQFEASSQALSMRISALEREGQAGQGSGVESGGNGGGELKSVKLASWLTLHK